jgi:hypothetical protein
MAMRERGHLIGTVVVAFASLLFTFLCAVALGTRGVALASEAAAVVVRQATNDDLDYKEFVSPIVIEVPISSLASAPQGKAWDAPPAGHFWCDDVTLYAMDITKAIPKSGTVSLRVWTHWRTRKQIDNRMVELEFSLRDSDHQIPIGRIEDVYVKAGDHTAASETFLVSASDFDTFFGPGKNPMLTIALMVRTG